jgi:hypothetical protein
MGEIPRAAFFWPSENDQYIYHIMFLGFKIYCTLD